MNLRNTKICIVLILFIVAIVSCIDPIYPENQYLQHLGTLFLSFILLWDIQKMKLSLFAYLFVAIFIIIHIIGARWIYSFVPYNELFDTYLGFDLNQLFENERNHYDRFVHLSFGVLFIPFLFEKFNAIFKNHLMSILLAWLAVQTFSLLYEVFEWLLTVFMDPQIAEDYNGQQGDIFDAQKDMALALLGSSIASLFYLIKRINK